MDFLQSLGPLALASRLKNLSDTLVQGVARIYREMDLYFEPRWFPVTHYLFRNGAVSVTSLANALHQTHPAILQVTQVMQRKGLVSMEKDEKDLRKTIIGLTPKGMKMAESLAETWEDIAVSTQELLEVNSADLLHNITAIEKALENEDIYTRVKKEYVRKRLDKLEIREYSSKYFNEFKEINFDWLKESVGISAYDEKVLNNPEDEILKKGGSIFLAYAGTEFIGTFILLPANKKDIELSKLAVKKSYRRMGIGKKLMNYAFEEAGKDGYYSVILLTHPTLTEAINLYRKMGFTEIPAHPDLPDPTGRCSITMQYIINH
jgi:ribosomal protein S18 acetylase RimI-like enzyme/DNA-binding MarR family transcriptional regulator